MDRRREMTDVVERSRVYENDPVDEVASLLEIEPGHTNISGISDPRRSCGARTRPYANALSVVFAIFLLAAITVITLMLLKPDLFNLTRASTCLASGDGYCLNENGLPPKVAKLLKLSMLQAARDKIYHTLNDGSEWRRPYGNEQSEAILGLKGDVWLDLYPASILAPKDRSVISIMGDEALWGALEKIGFTVIHTNPLHRSGGVDFDTLAYTLTCDGNYDRIALQMDPLFGTDQEYVHMTSTARKHNGFVAGDVVPGHTGAGADWLLALLNFRDYPYLYHMVSIKPEHWSLLPEVSGFKVANLNHSVQLELTKLGYIDGDMDTVIFKAPGVKETDWSVTGEIEGVDGVKRRWVYLHIFKAGQPSLNWLHPSFTAHQLIVGDLIYTLKELGTKIVRFDANFVLGTERLAPNSTQAKAMFHPLSPVTTEILAMTARKLNAFTYEENSANMQLLLKYGFSNHFGTDLSYDFTLRPGYVTALFSKDLRLLRLCLDLMRRYDIGGGRRSIHSLQNHDDMFYQFSYDQTNPSVTYIFGGKNMTGEAIFKLAGGLVETAVKEFNMSILENGGVCTTFATVLCRRLAPVLGIDCWKNASNAVEPVTSAALTLAAFNAFQPGVVQASAWDLLGVLELDRSDLDPRFLADADCRWLNRGGYDLMDYTKGDSSVKGVTGLPRARALFGPITEQLANPQSYASRLAKLFAVRNQLNISLGVLGHDLTPDSMVDKVTVMPTTWPDNPAVDFIAILSYTSSTHCLILVIINWSDDTVSFALDLSSIALDGITIDLNQTSLTEAWPNPSNKVVSSLRPSNTLVVAYDVENNMVTFSDLPVLSSRLVLIKASTSS